MSEDNIKRFTINKVSDFFIGQVYSTMESTDSDKAYKITFNIVGLPSFTEKWPEANPIFDNVREVKKGDYVFLIDGLSKRGSHTFFYLPLREDRFTGLKNYNSFINITEETEAKIQFPDTQVTINGNIVENVSGTMGITAKSTTVNNDVIVNGDLEVKGNITVTGNITCGNTITAGVDIKAGPSQISQVNHSHTVIVNGVSYTTSSPINI